MKRVARCLRAGAERHHDLRIDLVTEVVRFVGELLVRGEHLLRRSMELHAHLGAGDRKVLARPDIERNAGPAPRVDVQTYGRERLDVGVGRDSRLVAVALELTAHQVVARHGLHRAEHLLLHVAEFLDPRTHRRLHREQRDRLEEVVLHDVPQAADLFVELAPTLDAEVFRHRDLHRPHVVAIPDGFEKGVREAEVDDVLRRLLAEVVVDAKDVRLGKDRVEHPVELLRRLEVAPERLLHDHAGILRASGRPEAFHHRFEQARRNREVVARVLRVTHRLLQRLERRRVRVVAVDIFQ